MDSNKFKLSFLLLAAALPISLATWVFNAREIDGIRSTTNNGILITPVMDITEFDLRDTNGAEIFQRFEDMVAGIEIDDYEPRPWLLIYLGTKNCDNNCQERLHFLRQLHIRLSGESDRVERYYVNAGQNRESIDVSTQTLFANEFPDLKLAYSDASALLIKLARTTADGIDPIALHYIYVVDPIGNVMLYFTPENTTEEIFKDLDKLLDQSSLG
ncbi:hypothetical protein OAP18_03520 [Gammaproteobacteria bacterium]|nr:hypothetical protein [Gammaproteobacteria bacterium]